MKRHSVRSNIIKMLIVFMCAITIVFGWLFYREKQDETRRIKDDEYGQYIVELNEVKQLYDSGSTDADEKLDAVMNELREQKLDTDKSGLRNIVIMYIVVLCVVIVLFLYTCLFSGHLTSWRIMHHIWQQGIWTPNLSTDG